MARKARTLTRANGCRAYIKSQDDLIYSLTYKLVHLLTILSSTCPLVHSLTYPLVHSAHLSTHKLINS